MARILCLLLYSAVLATAQPELPVAGFAEGPRMDRVAPGRLIVDPPTLENLGFRWYIEGDSNRNASVTVSWRERGESAWKEALPLLRVHHEIVNQAFEPFRTGNLFAGSVLFLKPGTKYEVRLVMRDPDGGAPRPKTITATTRAEPGKLPARGRRIPVQPPIDNLLKAYAQARPGDVLVLAPGLYEVSRTIVLDRPHVAFVGDGGGETVIQGPGHETDLFDILGADGLWFENLTMRRARMAIQAGEKGSRGASGLVVRRCHIQDVIYGITTTSTNSTGWYIADNVLTGINPTWYPRPRAYMSPSHTGIRVYGRGHVVCHNRVSRFSDGIDIASVGMPGTDVDVQPVAIDFYNNDVSFAQDDAIETDYGAHNVRVYRNRCYNAHTGLSVQPFYGGPVYLVRNEIYGITSLALKLHNYCAGILAYHNTSACAGRAFLSFSRWQNGHLRNNLMLGGAQTRIAIETGTISAYSTLDYNGYRRFPGDIFIRWHDGRELKNYGNLEEFSRATGYERHGLLIDYDAFIRARPPQLGVTSGPGDYDLRLNPDARAVDAGIHLPNVNDDFAGKAPDLGCYERGSAIPLYGPRP